VPILSDPAVPAQLDSFMDVPKDPDVPVAARVPPAAVENVDSPPAARSRGEPRIGGVSLLQFILSVPGCSANDRDVAEGAVDRCLFQILGASLTMAQVSYTACIGRSSSCVL
jgi:hypothetical protein